VSDGRDADGDGFEDRIARAMKGAGGAARPRPEFRDGLRERFVDGALAPAVPASPGDGAPAPVRAGGRALPFPRWIAYPAAAAILAAAFALSGALGPKAPVEPVAPIPGKDGPVDLALTAVVGRLKAVPALAGRSYQRRVIEGRPWLLPAETAFAEGRELRAIGERLTNVEKVLARALPEIAARTAPPVVTLVAPDRAAFEAVVAPRIAPFPLNDFTVAYALRDLGALLVSPDVLEPGGLECEPVRIALPEVHAWLAARAAPGVRLPLWADAGINGRAGEAFPEMGMDAASMRRWCREVLASARQADFDPFDAVEVLALRDYPSMARLVASRAPRPEGPCSLLPVFTAHAEGLVLFLTDEEDGPARRDAFGKWLLGALDGKGTDPAATAKAMGFESPEALFAARDKWLGR
jgi:hypothetical protein